MKKFHTISSCVVTMMLTANLIAAPIKPPKLILQLTIDQFAGNQLDRFKQHLADGGFAKILKHALWYDNAHHPHATTQTAVGHTTLATGSVPAIHGIIANNWRDRTTFESIYAMEDPKFAILGSRSKDKKDGRSPANINVPSFADSLALGTHNQSKRFAVSTKDRGAIPLAGKMGKAFWFDTESGRYVSSKYYYQKYPTWVNSWNDKQLANKYVNHSWQLSQDCNNYIYCQDGRRHFKSSKKQFKPNFPHPFGKQANKSYYRNLTISPIGDEILLDFAKQLLVEEKLGRSDTTDYLSISLSATDAIGHTFGPNSLESEDNFIRLNTNLNQFLQFVDTQVGLNNVLIVLSADHGVSPSPTYLQQFNYPSFEVDFKTLKDNPKVSKFLKNNRLNWNKLVINQTPDLYLNQRYLKQKKLAVHDVILKLTKALKDVDGIAQAIPSQPTLRAKWRSPLFETALLNQIYPERSGDIYLIPSPYCYISSSPYDKSHHGTPWAYDTHVPIIFSHPAFSPERIHRKVFTTQLAPTLAAINHTPPLAGSQSSILIEFSD